MFFEETSMCGLGKLPRSANRAECPKIPNQSVALLTSTAPKEQGSKAGTKFS